MAFHLELMFMRSYTLPTLAKGYKFAINNCAAINLGMKWNIVIKWRKSSEIICMWMRAESFQEMGKLARSVFNGLLLKFCYSDHDLTLKAPPD